MKLSELKPSHNIKLLCYGESGNGKTVMASSFPGPIYFADFDCKVGSAANYLRAYQPEKLDEIEYDQFPPGESGAFKRFYKKLCELEVLSESGKLPFKTIVLDSLTTFSQSMMGEIMAQNPKINGPAPGTPGMQHYLIFNTYFINYINRLLALKCHVVVIGHIQTEKDELTGEIRSKLMVSGKLPDAMPRVFREVYRSFTLTKDGKPVYVCQTRPDGKFVARTEITQMPPVIPANFEAIQKYVGE